MKNNTVITRYAPSPTGLLTIGGVRTMLYSYFYAKKFNGKFILRIEDTDKERSKPEYTKYIFDSMEWLKIKPDEVYIQSEEVSKHESALKKLIDGGHAYISKEAPKEEGQRSEVIRFKNPNKVVTFHDEIRGDITFDTTELGDFVIAKSLTEPLYHLAVIVDDINENVTHVIRGDDHISNTPRQILLIEALGGKVPIYAHLPLILAPDRSKLSKRKHSELVATLLYRDKGYLPEAMINFMSLLGWNPGDEREIFTIDELIKEFDLRKIQKSGAIFNVEKFKWMNKEYLKRLPENIFDEKINSILEKHDLKTDNPSILKLIKERIEIFSDIENMINDGDIQYLFKMPEISDSEIVNHVKKIIWKDSDIKSTILNLEEVIKILNGVTNESDFKSADSVKALIWPFAEKQGRGSVLWPIRYGLSTKDKSPDPFTLISILGKNESLKRLNWWVEKLKAQ